MSESAPLDSTIDIVTPENIAFQYRVAGPFIRLFAFIVDVVFRVVVLFTLGFALALAARTPFTALFGLGVWLLLFHLLAWFYGGVLETFFNGQTLGKRLFNLRVLTSEGEPINGMQAVMRNILREVDLFPPLAGTLLFAEAPPLLYFPTCLIGLAAMTLSGKRQRLGDMVCGTVVVREERHWLTGVARLEDPRVPRLAELVPADFVVTRSLAQTLSMYVERRRFFSPERRSHIARHVAAPLLQRFGMPEDTSYDLLLCALYYRAFITDRAGEQPPADLPFQSPFATTASPSQLA